jgi:hypothetical protein
MSVDAATLYQIQHIAAAATCGLLFAIAGPAAAMVPPLAASPGPRRVPGPRHVPGACLLPYS